LRVTFIDWCSEIYGKKNVPSIREINTYFEDKFFKEEKKTIKKNLFSKGWTGFCLKNEDIKYILLYF